MKTAFLDSNVLVYLADNRDRRKQTVAREIVHEALTHERNIWISVQTLTEFINVALGKLKLETETVARYLSFFEGLQIVNPDRAMVRRGLEIRTRYKIQYYDSVMLAAAERVGAEEIFSEDLSDGQYYGTVQALNPFK